MSNGMNREELRQASRTFMKTEYERHVEHTIKLEKQRKRKLNKKNRKASQKHK